MSKANVKLRDLVDAFDMANFGGMEFDNSTFVDTQTGEFYHYSEYDDGLSEETRAEIPNDLLDNDRYRELPDKRDLDLGKQLALGFAEQFMEDDAGLVDGFFSRPGAYGNFKNLLAHKNLLDEWYQFEEEAQITALKRWCKDNDLEVVE